MDLQITPTRLITEVQKEFNAEFPYLKLVFFQSKPGQSDLSLNKVNAGNLKIFEVQWPIKDGSLELKNDMKVKDLEKIFKNDFGLAVQVFRHSGNLWLETTMTDNWTLQQQNEHGKEISSGDADKSSSAVEDYDLTRDQDH